MALLSIGVLIAVGVVVVLRAVYKTPVATFDGRQYQFSGTCRPTPPRSSLHEIAGFKPLGGNEVAMVTAMPGTPVVVYVWRTHGGCVDAYNLEGGP